RPSREPVCRTLRLAEHKGAAALARGRERYAPWRGRVPRDVHDTSRGNTFIRAGTSWWTNPACLRGRQRVYETRASRAGTPTTRHVSTPHRDRSCIRLIVGSRRGRRCFDRSILANATAQYRANGSAGDSFRADRRPRV